MTTESPTSNALSRRAAVIARIDAHLGRLNRARRHGERLDALVALVLFLREPAGDVELSSSETGGEEITATHRHLALFAAFLERSPAQHASFVAAASAILSETNALSLFAEGGLRSHRGILVEAADRLSRRWLPRPREEHELSASLPRFFPDHDAWVLLTTAPVGLFERLRALFPPAEAWKPVRAAMEESLCLLAARITTLGLSQEMRERRNESTVRTSPWYDIGPATSAWLDAIDASRSADGTGGEALRDAEARWTAVAIACRRGNEEVRTHLEEFGVSVEVVYGLDVIERHLDRMSALFDALSTPPGRARGGAIHALLRVLVRGRQEDRSVRALLRENLGLLARKVIERTGETGEHYITATRAEWGRMWVSAAGGGLVTTATAAVKTLVAHTHFPIFVEFVLAGSNYAISFIVIQILGFTLATKQPAMTAATLAGILQHSSSTERSELLATHVARIVRSQLAAAFGNILAVTLGAILFARTWELVNGRSFMDAETGDQVLRSLDPAHSGTIAYAALTGVILWISGLAAGWVGNWVVYRRLPQAIAQHQLGERFGPHRMQSASTWFTRNVGGLGGCVALGFLLAAMPAIGQVTGLPIQVRHVTLSSGQLVLAASPLGSAALQDPRVHAAMFGIAVIFVMNLGVSFVLALALAGRARNATARDWRDLLSALVRRLARRPFEFFVPPRTKAVVEA